jgi:hypothetical protein
LKSVNRKGHEKNPDTGMGVIQQQILEAIYDVEKDNNQMFFDIWCEARLPNGQYICIDPGHPGLTKVTWKSPPRIPQDSAYSRCLCKRHCCPS